jgi:hypothetical protein
MTNRIRAQAVPALLKPGMSVFVQGGATEPASILDAIAAAPDSTAGVSFSPTFPA